VLGLCAVRGVQRRRRVNMGRTAAVSECLQRGGSMAVVVGGRRSQR